MRYIGCEFTSQFVTLFFFSYIDYYDHCTCNFIPRIANHFDMGDIAGLIAPRGLVIVNGKTYSFSGITADQIEALNNATHNNKQATTVREKNATSARVIAYYESFEEYCNGDQYAKNVLLAKNSTAEEYTKGLDDQIAKLQQQRAEKIAYHTAVNAMEDCNAHLVEKWQKQNDQAKLQAMKKTISYEDALRRLMELEGNA